MQFNYIIFALMTGLSTNIHAASEPIPLDLIELLGEMDDSDALAQVLTESERNKQTTTETKPDAQVTQQAGGKLK